MLEILSAGVLDGPRRALLCKSREKKVGERACAPAHGQCRVCRVWTALIDCQVLQIAAQSRLCIRVIDGDGAGNKGEVVVGWCAQVREKNCKALRNSQAAQCDWLGQPPESSLKYAVGCEVWLDKVI